MNQRLNDLVIEVEELESNFENEENSKFSALETEVERVATTTKSRHQTMLDSLDSVASRIDAISTESASGRTTITEKMHAWTMQLSHNISAVNTKCDNQIGQVNDKIDIIEDSMTALSVTPAPLQLPPWSQWRSCTRTCGGGHRRRARKCQIPPCQSDISDCNTHSCPVWEAWEACSKTCGSGTRFRQLSSGSESETDTCNNQSCPIQWSSWSPCSVSCGTGS